MMRRVGRPGKLAGWSVLALVILAVPDRALYGQEGDAQILPPGAVRLSLQGEYLHFNREFASGGAVLLGGGFPAVFDRDVFEPLEELDAELQAFFAGTPGGAFPVSSTDLLLGTMAAEFSWNTRTTPVRLSVGVFPRLEVGVTGAVYRNERIARRVDVTGGLLGSNPDTIGNGVLLAGIDPTFAPLGRSPVLPLAGTALGQELQRRVQDATGESLELPDEAIGIGGLNAAYGVDPPVYYLSEWRAGDVEVDARVELIRSFAGDYYPNEVQGIDYRVRVGGVLRLPTGNRGAEDPIFRWGPEVGHGAVGGNAAVDIFVGNRAWISGGGSFTSVSEADVFVARYPASPLLPGGGGTILQARRSPGSEIVLWLVPRYRLTREISIGGSFRAERIGSGSDVVGGEVTGIPEQNRNLLGFSFRYTNLHAVQEGRTRVPVEVVVGFSGAVSGSVGAPAARQAFVRLTLTQRFWGGGNSP